MCAQHASLSDRNCGINMEPLLSARNHKLFTIQFHCKVLFPLSLQLQNYTIEKVKVCDRCQNIIHEQKLSILQCTHGFLVCMICIFNCQPVTDNPLGVLGLLKLDIDISTNTSTSSVSKSPTRFKHILQ